MSNISQFFAGSKKKNRKIFQGNVGLTTVTWLVPPGVTEVEVHCWGAGGDGALNPATGHAGGGGGGGYVTHVFPVTSSDVLEITVGASPGGTSSVSVPTQSPTSPISATGGSSGTSSAPYPIHVGGAGGTGSYTIAPGISTSRTFIASGGSGGKGPLPAPTSTKSGGGGSAGSPFGTGGDGGSGGGGGIGGIGAPGDDSFEGGGGGGSLGKGSPTLGGSGKNGYKYFDYIGVSTNYTSVIFENPTDDWFYVDEILGAGGSYGNGTNYGGFIHGGAGGGGARANYQAPSGNGGILGGGGAGIWRNPAPLPIGTSNGGNGGLAGGGGGAVAPATNGLGGAGLVILYW